MTLGEDLRSRQFAVVTGKGGVGKTLVTTLLGRWLADAGRHVLMLEADPRENLHELAGIAPSGGQVVQVGIRLLLQNVQPRYVMEQVVREQVKLEWIVKRVVKSPVFTHFSDAAPGIKEMAVLGQAYRLLYGHSRLRAGAVDFALLDAPATGHGVSMLAAPRVVAEVIDEGPFGHMAKELATFVEDSRRVAIVVVTTAEEMPVQEALELRQSILERLGREPDLLVVNSLYPVPGRDELPAPGRDVPFPLELWRQRRAINDRELARLDREWPGPRIELPMLPVPRGPALVDALAPLVGEALGRTVRRRAS